MRWWVPVLAVCAGCGGAKPPAITNARPPSAADDDAASFERACETKDHSRCALFGAILYTGKLGSPDEKRALAIFDRLCAEGFSSGCVLSGMVWLNGRGVPADAAKAQRLFRDACEADNPLGCQLAGLPLANDRPVTLREVEHATALCDMGTPVACLFAGTQLVAGKVVPKDVVRGRELIGRACSSNLALACAWLGGDALVQAQTSEEDARALAMLDQSCRKGAGSACNVLASAYAYGTKSVVADVARSTEYLRVGCDAAERECCSLFAIALAKGKGVVGDVPRALAILEPLCRDAHAVSCSRLGAVQYEAGERALAHESFSRGCSLGDELGCRAVRALPP